MRSISYITMAQDATGRAGPRSRTACLLLRAARRSMRKAQFNANTLIANMEELLKRTVGPEITVRTTLAPDLRPILCDPNQLENAILNLCINARDAMPDGGRLGIETSNILLDDREARASNDAQARRVYRDLRDRYRNWIAARRRGARV